MTNLSPFALLTRRRLLQGSAAVAASSLVPAFATGCATSGAPLLSSPVSNPQTVPTGTLTPATVTVAATSVGTIGPAFAGLSYEKSTMYEPLFTGTNTNLIALFERLGVSLLRVGGNSVDKNVWTPTGKGQTSGQIAPADVNALAAFLRATGWQCLYGVNLGGASTGATTPALAAAEVAYVTQALGSSLLGIEIGNECDLYGHTGNFYAGNWSLSQFETLWSQFRTAILATTPNANITGPASGGSEAAWTVPFGQFATKSEISLLTQHYYRADGTLPTSTAAFLITPDPSLVSNLQILQPAAQGLGIPYRISECNSFYNGGSNGVSDSYASSLWILDFLFNCAQNGASGVNFHGGGSSAGYTPIADNAGVVIEPRAEYYGILLFTLAGQGTLYQTQVTANSLNVTAYTVATAAGGLNLLLVNKDSTNSLQASLQLPQKIKYALLQEMTQFTSGATGPSLSAIEGFTIGGASVSLSGSFAPATAYTLPISGSTVTCYVPALSAVLVQLS
jgi:hypothetical protein